MSKDAHDLPGTARRDFLKGVTLTSAAADAGNGGPGADGP